MKRFLTLIFIITLAPLAVLGQQVTDVIKQERVAKFALTNAKIYTVTNGIIENGTVVISNGIIEAVGSNVTIPSDATVIDYKGGEIYPGMIDSGTQLGLVEINSIDVSKDFDEFGAITPQMDALSAVNPNSVSIPVTRVSGITTVLTMPGGGLLPGTAATINLFGYTPDQMFTGSKGIVLNFPNSRRSWRQTQEQADKAREKAMEDLNNTFDKAELFAKIENSDNTRYYPEMEALAAVVKGEMMMYVEVNAASDILKAIEWLKERKLNKIVFTGVAEGWRVADKIAEAGIPVIAGPTLSTPTRQSDAYDAAYKNPGIMHKAGVKVALSSGDTENSRNLPYNAAFAASYGMGREEALKAITINAAEIMGLGDQIGSIEVGKKANLFVATGDPFETKTQIMDVYIDGYQIPMTSRQIELYQEFLNRTPGLQKHPVTDD